MPVLRISADRAGLPPLIIVQGGPGLPIFHEIPRYRRAFGFERRFSVAYWEQPGCGPGRLPLDARIGVDFLVEELRTIIRSMVERADSGATLFGVSFGSVLALRAAELEGPSVSAVVAVSPDLDVSAGDAFACKVLIERASSAGDERLLHRITRLGPPPYPEPGRFGERLRLVADLGGIEAGKRFSGILAGTGARLVAAYGPLGAAAAIRNMTAAQAAMLSELSDLDLFASWPEVEAPVRWIFGALDPLIAPVSIDEVRRRMKPRDSLAVIEGASHFVHFDRPAEVLDSIQFPDC
jgi:pimeloyl-ACP methyl ester carboxylesterase